MMDIEILTAERPHKLVLTLQSLGFQIWRDFRINIYDNGEVSVLEDEDVRNIIDWLVYWRKIDVLYQRVEKKSLVEMRYSIFRKHKNEKFCVIDDDIVLEPDALYKLVESSSKYKYVVPVCLDIVNLLEHKDYSREAISIEQALKLSDGLKRHRLYKEDEEIKVKYADLSTVVFREDALERIDWDKYFNCELWTEGIALTGLIGLGCIRTGAISYHNTSRQWFKDWRNKLDVFKRKEIEKYEGSSDISS